jgi:D-sedoheptulose 7-phosphate isomerase
MTPVTHFADEYIAESLAVLSAIDGKRVEDVADGLAKVRARAGRLFVLGVGGSAGYAGQAVSSFRKLCGFEAYAPTDSVVELTEHIDDDVRETTYEEWLKHCRLRSSDAVLVFSVGGGTVGRPTQVNLVRSVEFASTVGASVFGITGSDGGYITRHADACIVVPPLTAVRVTPHSEEMFAVVWHLLVSHPSLVRSNAR